MERLKNKVAIVTGGNSGIGKGIAERFLQEGAKVVIFGRNQKTLDQTKKELGGNLLTVCGDVTNTEDLKNLYKTTVSHFGKIDTLVVNSGVGERLHIKDVSEENFDYQANINYRGAYFTVKYALESLNPKASIIFIASCAADITIKRHSVYASTKAAIRKLAKNLSYDLSEDLIR
ncbi:MAG: SDR family oxidoreductase, partial [Proteobacteria bacterium]|nr:SDR family oxidoreductase [Pseudomonadota bacterium]